MARSLVRLIGVLVTVLFLPSAWADARWEGVWGVEGTLFSIAVRVVDGRLEVSEVESLGFEWRATDGQVQGDSASIRVEYAGATATVKASLQEDGTAVATAANCMPDYLVVCALTRDRMARFVRLDPPQASSVTD